MCPIGFVSLVVGVAVTPNCRGTLQAQSGVLNWSEVGEKTTSPGSVWQLCQSETASWENTQKTPRFSRGVGNAQMYRNVLHMLLEPRFEM